MASWCICIYSCDNITDGVDGGQAQAARATHQVAALQEPEAVIEPLHRESRRYSEVEEITIEESSSKASDLLAVLGEGVWAGGQQDAYQPRQVGRAHLYRRIVSW